VDGRYFKDITCASIGRCGLKAGSDGKRGWDLGFTWTEKKSSRVKSNQGSRTGPGAGPGALESSGNKVLRVKGRTGNKGIKITFDAMQRL
jgi:hypothetical protein